jgi:hypothetical protein
VSTLSSDERAELEALRARVAALEAERAAEIARLTAALGEAQEKVYWLDRWRIDLNALMAKPGAAEFRAAVRAARAVVRQLKAVKRQLLG